MYTGGTPIGSLNKGFTSLAIDTFLGIPILIWIALIVAVCFWFLYNKTRHGKYMYAIGGNEAAAEVAGVNVTATKIRIYILPDDPKQAYLLRPILRKAYRWMWG